MAEIAHGQGKVVKTTTQMESDEDRKLCSVAEKTIEKNDGVKPDKTQKTENHHREPNQRKGYMRNRKGNNESSIISGETGETAQHENMDGKLCSVAV